MLTNIHIWTCLVFKKKPKLTDEYSAVVTFRTRFINRVDTRSNDTNINSIGLMILNNSNFKSANNPLLFSHDTRKTKKNDISVC